jgi:hypothetical protein
MIFIENLHNSHVIGYFYEISKYQNEKLIHISNTKVAWKTEILIDTV